MLLLNKFQDKTLQKVSKFDKTTFLSSHNQLTLLGSFGMTTQKWPFSIPMLVSKDLNAFYILRKPKTPFRLKKYRRQGMDRLVTSTLALVKARMLDVSTGVFKELCFYGRGWSASIKNGFLVLRTNYSHEVFYRIPRGIFIIPKEKQRFQILGVNSYFTAHFLHSIIHEFKRDVYLGKGIGLANVPHVLKSSAKASLAL